MNSLGKIWAIADAFEDRAKSAVANITKECKEKADLPPERVHIGIDAYKKVYSKPTDIATYTFQSYDAALIVLDGISRAIDAAGGNKPTRAQVRDAIAKTKDFKGITGTWTFDQNGDITTPVFSYYQSDPTNTATGGWKYLSSQGVTSSS